MDASFLVTDVDFPAAARVLLERRQARATYVPTSTGPAALLELLKRQQFDAMIVRTVRITDAAMAATPPLRVISKFGVGVDNIDVAAATGRKIAVLNTHGRNAQSVAELAFLLMLALKRRLLALDASIRQGHWDRVTNIGGELKGHHLCIVGYGCVGRATHAIARGFGLRVSAYDPYVDAALVPADATRVAKLDDALGEADIVTLHCPLTPETHGMIGPSQLARLKPTALLINTARGPIVDEAALIACLAEGRIGGAGLDTFADEPVRSESPLYRMRNTVFSPHMGGSTREAMDRVAVQAVENAFAILDGTPFDPLCLVNPRM
ncbi:MAG: hydroxyacid dehydrogenase [Alphaproteobacteria bacterium]|nr:hydroxyacid dehydrogenase [Alphaproteobacteria bacterium]